MNKYLNEEAFTLLEVLLAIVVVVIGITSLLPMLSAGISTDSYVEDVSIALNLAQEKIEEIKTAAAYADIDDFISNKAVVDGNFARFQREVTVALDPKEVNVIVYWTEKGGEQSLTLATLFANYDY
jgi:type II secretory pathway pseudopilin PulG